MADIFDFTDYREYIRTYAARSPDTKKRSGELKRIAEAARIFPSYLSQILNGNRDLTLDQAIQISDYLGFNESERKYFFTLVQLSRAATQRLKEQLSLDLKEIKEKHLKLSSRLPNQKEISIEDSAEFYSSWFYIAIRLLTAVPELQSFDALKAKLNLKEKRLKKILKFLTRTKLCEEFMPGHYRFGPAHMHLSADHPLITKHHANWRAFAMERHSLLEQSKELAYSGAFAISSADAQKIRAHLPDWIDSIRSISDPSVSETLYCLNIDWLEI